MNNPSLSTRVSGAAYYEDLRRKILFPILRGVKLVYTQIPFATYHCGIVFSRAWGPLGGLETFRIL